MGHSGLCLLTLHYYVQMKAGSALLIVGSIRSLSNGKWEVRRSFKEPYDRGLGF